MIRTGPIGRVARVVLAAAYAVSLASITGPRLAAQFRNPHILSEPLAWVLHSVMFVTLVLLAGAIGFAFGGAGARRRWQIGAVVVAAVTVAAFEIATRVFYGVGWGFPLADLVWWFDVVMLVEGLVATLLSAVIGLPGCEIGVWPLFIARFRGGKALPEEGLACVVGLHYLDAWEARRFRVYGKSD